MIAIRDKSWGRSQAQNSSPDQTSRDEFDAAKQ